MYIGLNAPKFETMTDLINDLLTRVKSRDASASKNYLRHVVVVKLVIAESHIHVQGEVLSGQDDTMFSKEFINL